jgi:hypothetical protein
MPDELKFWVLNRLFRKRCWGGKHKMNEDTLPKGAPKDMKKAILHKADGLVREGLLALEGGGLHGKRYFLNPRRSRDIMQYIEKNKDLV